MALPPDAVLWLQPIDPSDKTNFVAQWRGTSNDLLEPDEIIDDADIALLPEAIALGFRIIQDADHGPFIANDTNVEMWFEVDEAYRDNPAYSAAGTMLGVQITVHTDSNPPRRYQRTWALKAKQL